MLPKLGTIVQQKSEKLGGRKSKINRALYYWREEMKWWESYALIWMISFTEVLKPFRVR